ncbi:hypothetical protein [Natronorubrum halophilum]|uniref:hypothetical protein n=1 Tax=Natronorubrum halophilum TaxID=1702106 RepID=UPI0013CECEF4|nr:hypothetical protein [Natronorubrum halophilum]
MAHVPEQLDQYVCENCKIVHAGTSTATSGGSEPPDSCGACGKDVFVQASEWANRYE